MITLRYRDSYQMEREQVYDNQLIKRVYQSTGGRTTDGWAISMALNLYLDFINLFLSLLRLFGDND